MEKKNYGIVMGILSKQRKVGLIKKVVASFEYPREKVYQIKEPIRSNLTS